VSRKEADESWPRRVLVTNDDGITEERMWTLAGAFAEVAETWIVAPMADRSGTSNCISINRRQRSLFARREFADGNLTAYSVSGFPADCVNFGINGLLRERPPDLVVSGINGGPNLGDNDWFQSGTIGAARAAAYLGVPALALSGMRGADNDMIATAAQWIVGLSKTELVRELGPRQYLNVNLPDPPITGVRGVKVVETSPILDEYTFERVWNEPGEDDEETEELWVLHVRNGRADPGGNSDRRWYEAGYIVIVPMRVDENDESLRSAIGARLDQILSWPT